MSQIVPTIYTYLPSIIVGLFPVLVSLGVTWIGFTFLFFVIRRETYPVLAYGNSLVLVLGFSALGSAIGLFLGASREPVVASLAPAILTFIAGYATHLFGMEHRSQVQAVLPSMILFLIISTVVTASWGAAMRQSVEMHAKTLENNQKHRELVEWPVLREIGTLNVRFEDAKRRKELGLPEGEATPADK